MNNKIIILIPAHNPTDGFDDYVLKLSEEFPVVIVNDGSDDVHAPLFRRISKFRGVRVLTHEVNRGKGRALKTGMDFILKCHSNCTGCITCDADGQHRLQDVMRTARAIESRPNQLILGSRNFHNKRIPLRSRFGNNLTRFVYKYLTGIPINDTQTGLRGIPNAFMQDLLSVPGERFEFEMNMLIQASRNGLRISEIPIRTVYLNKNESSHFNPLVDSLKIYFTFVKYSFSSLTSALIDFVIFAIANQAGLDVAIALIIARVVSSLSNFLLNKSFVFKFKGHFIPTFIKYCMLVIIIGTASYFSITLLTRYLLIPVLLAKVVVETLLFFLTYYLQNRFVFKKPVRVKG